MNTTKYGKILFLLKKENKYREENKIEILDEEEADEEAKEIQEIDFLIKNRKFINFNIPLEYQSSESLSKTYTTAYDDYLNDLHIDVLVNLYRWEIKLGQELQVIHNQTIKLLQKQGFNIDNDASTDLSSTFSSKFTRKYTK